MSGEVVAVARERGMVVKWFPERGFGFIERRSGMDYWFHMTGLNERWSSDRVRCGQVVTFIPTLAAKGRVGLDVRLDEGAAEEMRAQGGDPVQTVEPNGAGPAAVEPERVSKALGQDPATETGRDEAVRLLAHSHEGLRESLAVFRELPEDEFEITVDDLHRRTLINGSVLRRGDVIAALRMLEAEGEGRFIPGRRGYTSRFESRRALRSLGKAGA